MTSGDREFEKQFPGQKALDVFPMDGTAKECPRCSLEFKTLLHPFCQHNYCPPREWGQAKSNTPNQEPRNDTIKLQDKRIAELEARVAALKAAGDGLAGFAGHSDGCDLIASPWTDPGPACDCGYTKAWQAWSAANGD